MTAIHRVHHLTLPSAPSEAGLEAVLETAGLPAPVRAHLLAEDDAGAPLALAVHARESQDPGARADLMAAQRPDGSFASVGATAAAIAALARAPGDAAQIAAERALEWLIARQRTPSDSAPGLVGSDLDTLAVLWQLGGRPELWSLDVPALVAAASGIRLAQREPFATIVFELQCGLWSATPAPLEVVSHDAAAIAA